MLKFTRLKFTRCFFTSSTQNLYLTQVKDTGLFYSLQEKDNIIVSELIFQVLIGVLLGDAKAYKSLSKNTTTIYFSQSSIHTLYLIHLFSLFYDYSENYPRLREQKDSRYNKSYYSWDFNTMSLLCFNYFYDLFYNTKGRKIVPLNIIDLLTPIGLAFWISDDGGAQKKGGPYLYTNAFTEEEVDRLVYVLQTKFNLNAKKVIKRSGTSTYPIIYISGKDLHYLRSLISPYLHSSMYYKLRM
jgi:LAGLIDADG DNA endonuclease family